MQTSDEQYLHEQLCRHTKTNPTENILTQLEKQQAASNINHYIYNGPHRNNTTHKLPTVHREKDNNQRKCDENNKQKISVNRTSGSRSSDNQRKGQDSVIRTGYGRIV